MHRTEPADVLEDSYPNIVPCLRIGPHMLNSCLERMSASTIGFNEERLQTRNGELDCIKDYQWPHHMQDHVNSASRLHLILGEGSAFSGDTATLKAWALLLHIKEPYDVGLSIDVSERLLWLNQELEILKRQLRSAGLHEERQDSVLKHIEQALSPVYLATDWNKVKQFLSPDTVTSLQHWAETLPETENPIEQEDMEAILAQAEEIKDLLDSSALPEELKFLVSQHVKSIRREIVRHPIAGSRALKEGAHAALGELIDIEETLKENCSSPEIRKLIKVWDKLNQLANRATVEEKSIKRSGNPWIYFCPGSS